MPLKNFHKLLCGLLLLVGLLATDVAMAQRKKEIPGTRRPKKMEVQQGPKKVWNSQTQRWEFADDEWRKRQEDYRYDPKKWKKSKYGKTVKRKVKGKPKGKGKENKKDKKGGKAPDEKKS